MTTSSLEARGLTRRATLGIAARLGVLVAAAAAVQVMLALQNPSPWIVPDEILYSELAKSIGSGHLPAVREVTGLGYGLVYPLLIAPAWAVFSDIPTAYAVARTIGAVAMASTAVPAYLLARRFVSARSALMVATFSVFVPSMLYSGTLLTEVALYPASMLAFLATAVALERPTMSNQVLVLCAIAVAVATKSLAIVMLPGYVAGILLMAVALRRSRLESRRYLRRFAPTWILFGLGAVALGLVTLTVGGGRRILGYNAQALDTLGLSAVPHWFILHVAELDLYVAAAPFFASVIICISAFRRLSTPQGRLFASVVIPAVVFLLLAIAAFSSDTQPNRLGYGWSTPEARMHERNMFALVPLLLIGLAIWLERSERTRSRWLLGAVALATVTLPALLPLSDLRDNANFQAMSLVPWLVFDDVVLWPLGPMLFTAFAVLALLRARSRTVWTIVGLAFAVVSLAVFGSFSASSAAARNAGLGESGTPSSWIDDAVGRDARVAAVWWEAPGPDYAPPAARDRVVWINEFFNRSVGPVYSLGAAMPYARLPVTPARLGPAGTLVEASGTPIRERYVLACGVDVDGALLERRVGTEARLYRVDGPIRIAKLGLCRSGSSQRESSG